MSAVDIARGTRTCADCRVDLPLSEFHATKRWPDGSPRWFRSYCKRCGRARDRVSHGISRRGQPFEARKPGLSPEARNERRRDQHRERMATDPEYAERHRARQREAAREARRRANERMATDPEYARELRKLRRRAKRKAETRARNRQLKEARRALRERKRDERRRAQEEERRRIRDAKAAKRRQAVEAAKQYRPQSSARERLACEPFAAYLKENFPKPDEAARAMGISAREIRAIVNGEHTFVYLRIVDHAFTKLGRPDLLNDLYPVD